MSLLPNPSLQITADHKIKLVEAPIHSPGKGQVLLQIKATGICGSDLHFWKTGRIGELVFHGDCIIGHEAAGVVLQAGEGVTNLKPGDRVAVEPGVPCENCFLCDDGRYNLCEDVAFAGVYPYAGTAQRYKVHPAKWLHKLPDNLSYLDGALLEPLSVVMRGIQVAQLSLGRGVVICGAGPIGLIAASAARASGAHPVVITDIDSNRLDFAKRFLPSVTTYAINTSLDAQGNAKAIRSLFGEAEYNAPDRVLECTGIESSIVTAAFTARRGGVVVVVGVGKEVIHNLPFMHLSLAEIDLKFINRYRDTWPPAITILAAGILDLKPLISHTFPLERANEALELCADRGTPSIKVTIVDDVDATTDLGVAVSNTATATTNGNGSA
ncbi:putative alcohol dehydrogenase [Aspergillus undulatus]|uniref:putative alcohol dehydrogenase n=1 Tax=Aspergillus undulatus TaxID=1810928 RepID=UPI003CCD7D58